MSADLAEVLSDYISGLEFEVYRCKLKLKCRRVHPDTISVELPLDFAAPPNGVDRFTGVTKPVCNLTLEFGVARLHRVSYELSIDASDPDFLNILRDEIAASLKIATPTYGDLIRIAMS